MKLEEWRSLAQIGQALWVDPAISRRRMLETLELVSLLRLQDERLLERASSALLDRAMRENEGIVSALLADPFFRLLPEERLILSALHSERWSYRRLARILGCTEEQVAGRAWKLRVHLASQSLDHRRPLASLGAAGTAARKPSCPEFDSWNPWTQRFLDEELSGRERIFLQNHLMACDDCRQALNRCRDLYFQVDAMVPRAHLSKEDQERELRELAEALQDLSRRISPSETTWRDAIRAFLRRTDAQLLIAATLTALVWGLLR